MLYADSEGPDGRAHSLSLIVDMSTIRLKEWARPLIL